jgi:8-oxo-dGTP diphosphatase
MPKFRMPTLTMTTDIVIFTIRDERLKILLIQRGNPPYQGKWALPGGLVEEDEDLDACAYRELEEETKVTGVVLEQLHAFGAPHRDPRGRLVTVAYYTLVRPERLKPKAASDAANVRWFAADALPPLAFDHSEIIAMARCRLRVRLDESADAFGFLPKTFTLDEFRMAAEIVGGAKLDPRRFRRRVSVLELIEETGKTRAVARRPVRLFRARKGRDF